MVIKSIGLPDQNAANLIEKHLQETTYEQPPFFGEDLSIQARQKVGYDLELLDAETPDPTLTEVVEHISSEKEQLVKFVELGQAYKVASFFESYQVPLIRLDLGQDLNEASVYAIEGKEVSMYYSPYPSAIYRLIKTFHPEYILRSDEETDTTGQQVIDAIRQIKPSHFIHLCEAYTEKLNRFISKDMEARDEASQIINNLRPEDFESMIDDQELDSLQANITQRFNKVPVSFIDPLTTTIETYQGTYSLNFRQGYEETSDVVSIVIDTYGETNRTLLMLHEYMHALMQGLRIHVGNDRPEVKISGLEYFSGLKVYFRWLNEAFTESLSQYLYSRHKGENVSLDSDYLASLSSGGSDVSYKTEISVLAAIAADDRALLSDGLRLYLGLPLKGEASTYLGKYINRAGSLLEARYGLNSMQLEGIYSAEKPGDLPKLLKLVNKVKERSELAGLGKDPDNRSVLRYFQKHRLNPDMIALSILHPDIQALFTSTTPLFSLHKDGRKLGAFEYLESESNLQVLLQAISKLKDKGN